jgi:serine/threonine protein kinase
MLTGFIGAGGMGAVYAAKHVRTGRELALKVLLPEFAGRDDLMARFGAEARAAGSLNHPGIVEVVDLDNDHNLHFIVMERLEGEELQARIQRDHPLDPAWVARVGADIADAIGCAHSSNPKIIHRDLKPQNVFLARKGRERDVVKILDFGIAKLVEAEALERSVTRSGEIYGTPLYMSPEQLRSSKDVDERADIYAIGVILYHALAGVTPFRGESFSDLVVAISTEEFPPLRSVRTDVPPGLAAVVERAMARNKQSRFTSAAQLRDALLRFAGGRHAALPDSFAETHAADQTTEKIPPAAPAVPTVASSSRRWLVVGVGAAAVVAGVGVLLGRKAGTGTGSGTGAGAGTIGTERTVTPAAPPEVVVPKAAVAADASAPPAAAKPKPDGKTKKTPRPGRDELPALRPR